MQITLNWLLKLLLLSSDHLQTDFSLANILLRRFLLLFILHLIQVLILPDILNALLHHLHSLFQLRLLPHSTAQLTQFLNLSPFTRKMEQLGICKFLQLIMIMTMIMILHLLFRILCWISVILILHGNELFRQQRIHALHAMTDSKPSTTTFATLPLSIKTRSHSFSSALLRTSVCFHAQKEAEEDRRLKSRSITCSTTAYHSTEMHRWDTDTWISILCKCCIATTRQRTEQRIMIANIWVTEAPEQTANEAHSAIQHRCCLHMLLLLFRKLDMTRLFLLRIILLLPVILSVQNTQKITQNMYKCHRWSRGVV